MKFGKMIIENFMSVESLEVTLSDMGLILVSGDNTDSKAFDSNGAGKSTVFTEAPCWALFGETIRGLTGDDVINRNVGKNAHVCLEILTDNGDTYTVHRYRKHKEYKNSVIMLHNGENITCKSDTDTTKYIIGLLDMDFMSFTNSVVFGQGISKMFAQATDSEQKKILERMLQIDILRACMDLAKQYLLAEDKTISDLNRNIELACRSRQSLLDEVDGLQEKEAQAEARIDYRIKELQGDRARYDAQLKDLPDTKELEEDVELYTGLIAKVVKKLEDYDQYDKSKAELTSDIMSLQKEVSLYETKMRTDKSKLQGIKTGKNKPKFCEACGQALPLTDTSHIEKHLEDSIKENSDKVVELLSEIEESKVLLNKVNEYLEGKKVYEQQKDDMQKALSETKASIDTTKKLQKNISGMIQKIDKDIADQESQRGVTYADIIQKKIEEANSLDTEIQESQDLLTQSEDLKAKYNFWVNSYGNQGIKSVLLDSVTPYLNQRANYYLSQLADSSIEVKFSTQTPLKNGEMRDKFAVEVINENGGDVYKANSGGEKKRVDIAVNMALQDLVHSRSHKRIDFIVYDELYDALDEVGCEKVIELLRKKARQYGTVVVITHNDTLKQMFNEVVTVIKGKDGSVIA